LKARSLPEVTAFGNGLPQSLFKSPSGAKLDHVPCDQGAISYGENRLERELFDWDEQSVKVFAAKGSLFAKEDMDYR
jgi:hypothetical protein